MTEGKRVFLFLQGPSSILFSETARHLEKRGAECLRINLNAGDRVFWRRPGAINYAGRFSEWRAFVADIMKTRSVTDLVLLGEERPYHRIAIEEAATHGVKVCVMEMGYLRPDWVTLECEGMSSNSRFPTDAKHILRVAEKLPEPDWRRQYSQSFFREALADLAYNLPTVFLRFLHPHYKRHALFHPLAEYAGWIFLRWPRKRKRERQARLMTHSLVMDRARYFLYPLQLQTDYQIRAHSPFVFQEEAIYYVLRSFHEHAPPDTTLVIKEHPLDNGIINWGRFVRRSCRGLGVDRSRVHVLAGGNFAKLVRFCTGMVTINSTSALNALQKGKPVKTMGASVYDVEGLCDSSPLDQFWANPTPPDPAVRHAFLKLLAASIQIRGNFYSRKGAKAAGEAAAQRLWDRSVNQPDAYADPAPRCKPEKLRCI